MSPDNNIFVEVERYIDRLFVPPDPVLDAAIEASRASHMPQIHVTPGQGKLLYLLTKMCGARRILEIGTLAGYSTIWMARALPQGGKLISLEIDPYYADMARINLARAQVADKVEVVTGPALDTLKQFIKSGEKPFDMTFIDADKENYVGYLDCATLLTRPGGAIIVDNVIRKGCVLDPDKGDILAKSAAAFNTALAANPHVESIIMQQMGAKGHDGLSISVVKDGNKRRSA